MRHYDLDGVALMGPFCRDLEAAMGSALAAALGEAKAPAVTVTKQTPVTRGLQVTLAERRAWRFERDGAALSLAAELHRFISPATGAINHTLELFVIPESRSAMTARVLLAAGGPLVGLLAALGLWRGLQWDTNMPVGPWLLAGALLGLALGLAALPTLTHLLGARLDGRRAFAGAKARADLLTAATAVVDGLVAAHSPPSAELAAAGAPPADEPAALAAYARDLTADPDAAIARYGLIQAAHREAIARAFTALEKDPARYRAFLEAREGQG